MNKVLVVAPHPDDETLGCGGTILKHIDKGDKVYWLIMTSMNRECGFTEDRIKQRQLEIKQVSELYNFADTIEMRVPASKMDTIPLNTLIDKVNNLFRDIMPSIVYIPFSGDVHSDHRVVFDIIVSCTKWFRNSSIKKILCYETISETDFGINPVENKFSPNVFVDISDYFAKKLQILNVYASELGEPPFPRNEVTVSSLARIRGAACGCTFAESFMLLKEFI